MYEVNVLANKVLVTAKDFENPLNDMLHLKEKILLVSNNSNLPVFFDLSSCNGTGKSNSFCKMHMINGNFPYQKVAYSNLLENL